MDRLGERIADDTFLLLVNAHHELLLFRLPDLQPSRCWERVLTSLANMTKGWSAYVLDVGVAYKEDTDRVVELMRTVAEDLRADPSYGTAILEPIEIFGVDDFAESRVTIKARLKTRPLEQWNVGREYRRRLKKAFDAARIEIPFPHRSLYVGEASRPLEVLVRASAANGAA